MEQGGVADPYGRIVALTAAPERAVEFGIDETRILPFAESVGGRYSLWSSIGFPAALVLGWEAFEELLEGAAAMDRHFRLAPARRTRRSSPPSPTVTTPTSAAARPGGLRL
jgi:glucose-6-phosphate isomerase